MRSELWQRLRAARRYADKRQQDIADACGVTRGAVAQWESAEPNHRTRPGITELVAVSRTTGVPTEWLLNDAADPNDVFKVGTLYGSPPAPASQESRVNGFPAFAPSPSSRALETFTRAVEFAVMERDAETAAGFRVRVAAGPLPLAAYFFYARTLAAFGSVSEAHTFETLVGHLLLLERAAGRTVMKHLILWQRPSEYVADQAAIATVSSYLRTTFGVQLEVVESPAAAAEYLVAAANH